MFVVCRPGQVGASAGCLETGDCYLYYELGYFPLRLRYALLEVYVDVVAALSSPEVLNQASPLCLTFLLEQLTPLLPPSYHGPRAYDHPGACLLAASFHPFLRLRHLLPL